MKFDSYLKENLLKNENEVLEKSSSYFQGNFSKWNISRCRIDVSFWPIVLAEILTKKNFKTENQIGEFYLAKTREIENKNRNYKNSNRMDSSALKAWFKITTPNKEDLDYLGEKNFDDIIYTLTEYIDTVIKK